MNPELTILKILKGAHPHMINTGTLWSEVLMADQAIVYSAYKSALRALEEKEQVVVITGEDRNKAKITTDGLARLAENNL